MRSLEAITVITQGSGKSILYAKQANIAGQQVVNNVAGGIPEDESEEEERIVRTAKNGNSPGQNHAG